MFFRYKKVILALFLVFTGISGYYATKLEFSFSFEQFFPKDDPDYRFYKDFIENFETDDNFFLIGLPNKTGIFDSVFLKKVAAATDGITNISQVTTVQSLTNLSYPVRTPFGFMSVPALHVDEPGRYAEDKQIILDDRRLVNNLINEDATATCISLKCIENIGLNDSKRLIHQLDSILNAAGLQERHYLGRAYFQTELVDFQTNEIRRSTIISGILITLFLYFLYRRPVSVMITLSTVGVGLLIFMGILGMMGQKLTALSALFPVLMLIVGSSDVIHIFTKYTDELKNQADKYQAMWTTIRQIGLATLITSLTTAFGFASLAASKLESIREFGLQSAMGVVIAYVTVFLFMIPLLLIFHERLNRRGPKDENFWDKVTSSVYHSTTRYSNRIWAAFSMLTLVSLAGIYFIQTNYGIIDNLPRNSKVREDFLYFENNFGGFRPFEFAVTVKNDTVSVKDFEVISDVNKLEEKLLSYPFVKTALSQATLYKSVARAYAGNQSGGYIFPEDEETFNQYTGLVENAGSNASVMISKDETKTRLSARIKDIGASRIEEFSQEIDQWINENTDTSLVSFKRTGTGLLMDKNSVYVRENILQGLGISLILISVLMGFMLRSVNMLVIALIPNLIPLLVAGGILGFFGIDLEAGISIVFAIIFGIAVDDTIHFLAKYKLLLSEGLDKETAIYKTIKETGKAIILTSVILTFGFMVMVFSQNPPTFTIGLLLSVTLLSALLCDLYLLPVLLRKFHNTGNPVHKNQPEAEAEKQFA